LLNAQCSNGSRCHHRQRQADAEAKHETSAKDKLFQLKAEQKDCDRCGTWNQAARQTKRDDLTGRYIPVGKPPLDVVCVRALVRVLVAS
jgi:hypothetical protein